MIMERWRDVVDTANLQCSEKNLFHCHSVEHKSHVEWPGIETGSLRWEEDEYLCPWHEQERYRYSVFFSYTVFADIETTYWTTGERRFDWDRLRDSPSHTSSGYWGPFLRVKRPGREADHSPKVKSSTVVHVFIALCLMKHWGTSPLFSAL